MADRAAGGRGPRRHDRKALDNPHRWSDEWVDESSLFDGRVERTIAEVFTTGEEQRHKSAIPMPGGRSRYFDTHLVPWRVEDEIRGVVIISHDQTSILRYQDQQTMAEKAMAQFLADLPVSVWEIDADSQIDPPAVRRSTDADPADLGAADGPRRLSRAPSTRTRASA